MRIVYFTHSLSSCWNHGNAHFLRGVLRELVRRGEEVAVYEPYDAWSARNLRADHGEAALDAYRAHYPELRSTRFAEDLDLRQALDGADLVIVHEWNEPWLVGAIGALRRRGGRFRLLFHDTHHRAVSDPAAIQRFDLEAYDGVLAFGRSLAEVYRRMGWGDRAYVWHEAADTRLFCRPSIEGERRGLVFIGNWGDEERTGEIEDYLLRPARRLRLPLEVYGVRYPPEGCAMLARYGAAYRGWLANADVPSVFGRHLATIHVPRRQYAALLPGIPTIRVFEALACGIPLVCAPWEDTEGLFRPGEDFLVARSPTEMETHMRAVAYDGVLRNWLVSNGLARIHARHTCAHRAAELLAIVRRLAEPINLEAVA